MKRIYVQTAGLSDWQARLADPVKHWKPEKSAYELAVCWEAAAQTERGLPQEIAALLDGHDATHDARLLFATPEHKVTIGGSGFPSQTDLWALLRGNQGLISMAVEGKAGESFDKVVAEWLQKSEGPNRMTRLKSLCDLLGVTTDDATPLRYQLFHRAASAIIEAERCGAATAILLVQSFGTDAGLEDFKQFATCLGADASNIKGNLVRAKTVTDVDFYLAWITCDFTVPSKVELNPPTYAETSNTNTS